VGEREADAIAPDEGRKNVLNLPEASYFDEARRQSAVATGAIRKAATLTSILSLRERRTRQRQVRAKEWARERRTRQRQ
jgi:hypothetical protein